jgi:hypothetical protein
MAQLQWGRDRVIAETARNMATAKVTGMLQWGRDRVIAETLRDGMQKIGTSCFNGAAIGFD